MALDKIHDDVKKALEKEGWHIRKEPVRLRTSRGTYIFADMEAERVIIANRGIEKIIVEVKSLLNKSIIYAFYPAFGQYLSYRDVLLDLGITDVEVYLATSYEGDFRMSNHPFVQRQIERYQLKQIVVDIEKQIIVQWKR